MNRRVVITTEASIMPIGNTKEMILKNLIEGKSGIKKLREDDLFYQQLKSRVFGPVDYEINYDFKRKYYKTFGPVAYYACQASKELIEKSGLDQDFISSGRMGVAFGSTNGSPLSQRDIYKNIFTQGIDFYNLSCNKYLQSMAHTAAANIAHFHNITGRIISSNTACTTASQSIGFGYETIKFGLQDAMICGEADEYDTMTVTVFDKMLAASISFNETPEKTPCPFDERRDGLVIGEGCGVLLLEDYDFAKKRGANILAEVIGFSCCNNGTNLVNPSKEGMEQTIRTGLKNAELDASDVDFIAAHATATPHGDISEAQAIYSIYKDRSYVSALKSFNGHTMSACGAIDTIITLYMMQEKIIVPTLNLENIDKDCKMIRHTEQLREEAINIASIQNFAFGGVNTCLFLKRFT